MLPLYIPRASLVHRAPAPAKLLLCLAASTAIVLIEPLWLNAAVLAAICGLYVAARLPMRTLAAAVRPVLIMCAIIFVLQVWIAGWQAGAAVVMRIFALVLLTSLVTLTTPLSDMIETITAAFRPLASLGLSPPKLALAIALTIRFIPTLLKDMQEIQRARTARGGRAFSALALGPLIVKILFMTNALGDAIAARGFENRK